MTTHAAPIKITDAQGNLIGKVQQIRRNGRRLWSALGKIEGRYVEVAVSDTRQDAESDVRTMWLLFNI